MQMAETRQALLAKLTESQARVAELEALLAQNQPNANALLHSEGDESPRARDALRESEERVPA